MANRPRIVSPIWANDCRLSQSSTAIHAMFTLDIRADPAERRAASPSHWHTVAPPARKAGKTEPDGTAMATTFRVTAAGLPPKLIMDSHIGESNRHIVLKVLGWLLFWRPDLEIEKCADQHYMPDLLAGPDPRRPDLWIDCGDTTLKK